jgi:3-hydroxyacyl-CoA dehydrogenase/enoyl-CoA hydratase/3-hydroxybutyryl-CoA epimerase
VAGLKAGMPMPPLALQDEVSLSLSLHISAQTRKDLAAEGIDYPAHPGEAVLRRGVWRAWPRRQEERPGPVRLPGQGQDPVARPAGDLPTQGRAAQPAGHHRPPDVHPGQRGRALLLEKVVRSVSDTNIGSIFGWGFAPHQGGALQFINAMGAPRLSWPVRVNWHSAMAHALSLRPSW